MRAIGRAQAAVKRFAMSSIVPCQRRRAQYNSGPADTWCRSSVLQFVRDDTNTHRPHTFCKPLMSSRRRPSTSMTRLPSIPTVNSVEYLIERYRIEAFYDWIKTSRASVGRI